jgi:dihydroxyacetone kinase
MSVRDLLVAATNVAIANEAAYSRLDAAAGDGDFGAVLARAARNVRSALDELPPDATDRELLLAAARAVAGVGGTTGPLWGTGLLRAADAIDGGGAAAVRAAAAGIAELGGAQLGDRTLLDALLPAADALETGDDPARAARRGAGHTAELAAKRGRASYVPGGGTGTVDAGAQAVADLIAAALGGATPSPPGSARQTTPDQAIVASPGHVVADPQQLVDDAISGLVVASAGRLRASTSPRFVARADLPRSGLVALISGGGSGHEPMHSGLIGPGLLAAACPGEVFASPSAAQVEAAIEAVDDGSGVLLVVKNYTGDVLNFRLGAELARAAGHQVDTVLVADDIALDDPVAASEIDPEAPEGVGRRGVAGTIVVEKICGAAAEAGADLAALAALGRRVAGGIRTIGVSVSGVTLPGGGEAAITLESGEQEFGVGIHGEAGRERGTQQPADQLVTRMCQALLDDSQLDRAIPVLLYTNGLGGLAGLELMAAHGYAVRHLKEAGLTVARSMAGSLVTSLGMVGFSLTIATLDDELTAYWDAPCDSPAWVVR